jgi:hypothetical protein
MPAAVALITCGFPLGIIAEVPVLDVALTLVAAWGIGMAVADVATLSLLYRLLDIPLLPRVTAVIESAKLALEGVGAPLAPLLVSGLGIEAPSSQSPSHCPPSWSLAGACCTGWTPPPRSVSVLSRCSTVFRV